MNDLAKNLLLWVVVAVVLMVVFQSFQPEAGRRRRRRDVRIRSSCRMCDNDRIKSGRISPTTAACHQRDQVQAQRRHQGHDLRAARDEDLVNDLINHNVEIKQAPPQAASSLVAS